MALLPFASAKTKVKEFQEFASDPANPYDGQVYLNTSTNQIKVYYASQWQVLHTLTKTAPAINIQKGQPMGLLLALTYSAPVN